MSILSIQSHVASGRVGNSIVAFALQRLGIEVWPVHTVLFSNHPGHGPFRGKKRSPEDLSQIILGLEEHGVLGQCDAVLAGYLGSAATGQVVLDAVARVRAASPEALFFLDPVMGDEGKGLYVPEELVSFYKNAAGEADMLAPNAFELSVLTGRTIDSAASAAEAARTLLRGRTRTVFVTSVAGNTPDRMTTLTVSADEAVGIETSRLAIDPKGAGDLFMALVAANTLSGKSPVMAAKASVETVWSLSKIAADEESAWGDLPLLDHQDLLISPPSLEGAKKITV